MSRPTFFLTILPILILISCSKDQEMVIPTHTIMSDEGVTIELEWNTGGSTSQALHEADLDLYLDLGTTNIATSANLNHFEGLHLRDVYKDGTYSIYIGAIEVNRRTTYNLFIAAPGDHVIHKYEGELMAGEEGEIHYLNIRKEGRRYTLIDL